MDRIKSVRSRLFNPCDPPVVVLIYHRVTTLPTDPHMLAVTPEYYRAQMCYLRDHFPVLGFGDDWGRISEPSVVVTFDDGYADNFLEALPIIEDVGVPVTFFVSSGAIGSDQEFWWDELERLILGAGSRPDRCLLSKNGRNWSRETGSMANRLEFHDELHPLMRKMSSSKREIWLTELRNWAGCDRLGRLSHRAMSADQLKGVASSRWITVGAHGVTHTRLSNLSPAEQRYEIMHSKQHLEDLCHKEIRVFSYPFGCRGDYNGATVELCRAAGFRRVAANFPGQVHCWSDAMQLPRQLVRNWPLDQFKAKLDGFFLV